MWEANRPAKRLWGLKKSIVSQSAEVYRRRRNNLGKDFEDRQLRGEGGSHWTIKGSGTWARWYYSPLLGWEEQTVSSASGG